MRRAAIPVVVAVFAVVLIAQAGQVVSRPPDGPQDPPDREARIARKAAEFEAPGLADRPSILTTSTESVRVDVVEDETVISSTPDTNYGAGYCGGGLRVGAFPVPPDYRTWGQGRGYLKFGLSAIPAEGRVTQATLSVRLACPGAIGAREIGVYGAGDGWTEGAITWNNAPPVAGGPYSTIAPPFEGFHWYQFDVTPAVAAEARGDGAVTLVLREVTEGPPTDLGATDKWFAEREWTGAYIDVQYASYADAGPDQTIEQATRAGTEVTLDGSGSIAPPQDPAPTTYAEAVAAGATVNSLAICTLGWGSWGFDGQHVTGWGPLDFGICQPSGVLTTWDFWYSVTSWGETWPGYYLAGWPAGGQPHDWPRDASGQYTGYVDVYADDWTPPSTVPWRVFVSPDGLSMAWKRLPGIAAYEWYEGEALLGVGLVIKVTLPLGTHTITLRITNTAGVTATDTVVVTVVDTAPPTLTRPPNRTTQQTSRDGTPFDFGMATATDLCDAAPAITNDAPALFPLGITWITWTARDASGNTATAVQRVTVRDTIKPKVFPPPNRTVQQTSAAGTPCDIGMATATDICDAAPVITNDAPALFPLGITLVTWTARDASGNTGTAVQKVTVRDTIKPMASLKPWRSRLPNDNRMYLCATLSNVRDICDAAPAVAIGVTANEPIDAPGSAEADWYVVQANGTWEVWLRGERTGSAGRTYTVTATVTDASGNVRTVSALFTVPI